MYFLLLLLVNGGNLKQIEGFLVLLYFPKTFPQKYVGPITGFLIEFPKLQIKHINIFALSWIKLHFLTTE